MTSAATSMKEMPSLSCISRSPPECQGIPLRAEQRPDPRRLLKEKIEHNAPSDQHLSRRPCGASFPRGSGPVAALCLPEWRVPKCQHGALGWDLVAQDSSLERSSRGTRIAHQLDNRFREK